MRYLASRGLLLLLTLLGLLSLFHNAWRPVFLLGLCLLLVAHLCYSLLVNDSLLSPQVPAHFLHLLATVVSSIYITSQYVAKHSSVFLRALQYFWRQIIVHNMKRIWNSYQLSCDPKEDNEKINANSSIENKENKRLSRSLAYGDCLGLTSTPLATSKSMKNGGLNYNVGKNNSSLFGDSSNISMKEEHRFVGGEQSSWSARNSPNMRPKASGIKTVQTVAGPLLASTRYNIDPKIYTDIASPGLTTRLTKYATEANSKLTHQPRYGAGQFPKVNLHASPTPVIKLNSRKTAPVTVRVAPSIDYNRTPGQKKATKLSPSEKMKIEQALEDMCLKRHASRDDVTELAKKQRTELPFHHDLGNLEELTQKRSREDSPKSDKDTSAEYKGLRPKKRTKTSSCNDIINSLSSSIHVFSGTKRKAEDSSREFEKHFKSLNKSQSITTKEAKNTSAASVNSVASQSSELSKSSTKTEKIENVSMQKSSQSVKQSDKLFMGVEPENNENLRELIEEQGNINPKFSLDDKDEIRKEDIALMRQTSMKTRLQSMFDAISGKTNKINPDVVIHAEEIGKEPTTPATLTSATSTTNVNISPIISSAVAPIISSAVTPIISSAVAPIIKSTSDNKTSSKTVTFNLATPTPQNTGATLKMPELSKPTNVHVSSAPNFSSISTSSSSTTSSTPKFSFGSNVTPVTTVSSSTVPVTVSEIQSKLLPTTMSSTFSATTSTPGITLAPSIALTSSSSTSSATPTFSFGGSSVALTSSVTQTAASPSVKTSGFGITTSSSLGRIPTIPSFGQITTAAPVEQSTTTFSPSFGKTPVKTTTSAEKPSSSVATSSVATTTDGVTKPTFTFGKTTSTTANESTASSFSQTVTTSFNQTSTPTLSFSQTNTTVNPPTLTFGQTAVTSSSPSLSFNQTVSTPAKTLSNAVPIFGQTATTNSTGVSLFGNVKSTTTTTSDATKPIFGTVTTSNTSSGIFNTPKFVFGNGTMGDGNCQENAFNAAKATTTSSFKSLTPSFSTTTAKTSAPSVFNVTNTATPSSIPSNIFGTPTSTVAAVTSPSMFSGSTLKSTPIFGSMTNPMSSFGMAATTATTPLTAPSFGSSTVTTAAPTFGSNASSFGATTTTSATSSSSSSVVPSTPTFGAIATSSETPSFGSQSNPTPAFGAIANPSINFGATSNGFGNVPTQSPFGSVTQTQTPTFGSTVSTTTPSTVFPNGSFSFSSNTAQPTSQATQPSFNFSSSNSANNAGGVFQFGAGASKPGPFSFNATSAPNLTFGATSTFGGTAQQPGTNFATPTQGGNMFSIGTGTAAPRTRTVRDRLRRQR